LSEEKLSWLGFGLIFALSFIDRMRQKFKRRGGRHGE
jgi:hypothetical protein